MEGSAWWCFGDSQNHFMCCKLSASFGCIPPSLCAQAAAAVAAAAVAAALPNMLCLSTLVVLPFHSPLLLRV
jgi:hypothetical protein